MAGSHVSGSLSAYIKQSHKLRWTPALGYYTEDLGILANVFQGSNSAAGVT